MHETDHDPNWIYGAICAGSPIKVESAFLESFQSQQLECLRAAYLALIRRCSADLAKENIKNFNELGLRLNRSMKRMNFPLGWDNTKEERSLLKYSNYFEAIAELGIATGEIYFDPKIMAYLKSNKRALLIIKILKRFGPLRHTELKNKFITEHKKIEPDSKVFSTTFQRPLEKLIEAKLVKKYEKHFDLSFLGKEIRIAIDKDETVINESSYPIQKSR